jgi:hypothetical protein
MGMGLVVPTNSSIHTPAYGRYRATNFFNSFTDSSAKGVFQPVADLLVTGGHDNRFTVTPKTGLPLEP